MGKKTGLYLHNLNGIRAIAALMVLVHHVEQMRHIQGMDNFWHLQGIRSMGKIAVILFFSLSGFLITFLIEKEKKQTGTLNVLDFYVRRSLRIWPLYYLVVCLGLFVFPHIEWLKLPSRGYHNLEVHYEAAIAMYFMFLPNFFLNYFGVIPLVAHTWSIGIEEQFYLLWPWLVRQHGKALRNICLFILGYNGLRLLVKFGLPEFDKLIYFPPLTAMAIGGIFGLIYIQTEEKNRFRWLKQTWLQASVLIVTTVLTLFGVYFPFIYFEVYAFLFGWCMLYLASAESLVSLENKAFLFLGKISFGLYMYHPLIIHVVFAAMLHFGFQQHAISYILVLGGNVLLAWISYVAMESRFIRWKAHFSRIKSGPEPAS